MFNLKDNTFWGCEDHFTTIEVNNESMYVCEHCYEKYKKVFIDKGYIEE